MHQNRNQDFNNQPQPKRNNLWLEGAKTVGLSLFFAFGIRTLVAEPRYVASGSMIPTLEVNDRLMIDKLSYHWSDPKRGDIVMFSPTEKLKQQNLKDTFIKRLIGLPGEKVEIKAGRVYINDRLLQEKYIDEKVDYHWGPVIVPPNSYLFVGVWGSYKTRAVPIGSASGYMDSPRLILWDSMSLKLTFNVALVASKPSSILEC